MERRNLFSPDFANRNEQNDDAGTEMDQQMIAMPVDEAITDAVGIDSVVQKIAEFYELNDDMNEPGLRCSQSRVNYRPGIHIPNFMDLVTVDEISGVITWSFEMPEDIQEFSTASTSKRETPSKLAYKMRHEFVAEALVMANTDIKLKEVYPVLHDEFDNLTPDFTVVDANGCIHSIELGTTQGIGPAPALRSLNTKIFKYEVPISERSRNLVSTLTIIIVTPSAVYSNVPIPDEVSNDMIIRMKIALAIESKAAMVGIEMTSGGEDVTAKTKMAESIEESLSKIKIKENGLSEDDLMITKGYIDEVRGQHDMNIVRKSFKICYEKSLSVVSTTSNNDALMDQFKEERSSKSHILSSKPISIMPLVDVKTDDSGSDIAYHAINSRHSVNLSILWGTAFNQADVSRWKLEDVSKLREEAYCNTEKDLRELESSRKATRKNYRRVDISSVINDKMLHYLQMDGIYAKRANDEMRLIQRKKRQSMPFHIDSDCVDIQQFLDTCSSLLEPSNHDNPRSITDITSLIEKSLTISKSSRISLEDFQKISKTKLFSAMDLISDIAIELAISVKQNCKFGEFILKKVRNRQVYILISPTNSQSHCFFSLFFPKLHKSDILCKDPFVPLFDMGSGMATEFKSVRVDKLENLSSMSASVIAFTSFWSWFYSLSTMDVSILKEINEFCKMLMITLMVKLEDKSETEETITLSRYMYMEIFKSVYSMKRPDPLKLLSKLSNCPRSRLNLYFQKEIMNSFYMMSKTLPRRIPIEMTSKQVIDGEDTMPGDEWRGLLNCLTRGPISNATQAVNIMYVGYVKNKNETAQGNTDWQLLEKILEEEFTLKWDEIEKTKGNCDGSTIPGKKQFSKHHIMHGSSLLEKKLESTLGTEWKTIVNNDIMVKLSEQLTHTIATMKASSSIPHSSNEKMTSHDSNNEATRIKVIEAICKDLELMGLNPMASIDKILNKIESTNNGIIADLFKKNQHGGTREIYVVTIWSRILQLYIECISRVFCSYFDEETLTHPKNKMRLLDNHKLRSHKISKAKNNIYADYCSSSDKTRWNQNFVMMAMCIPLFRMTKDIHHGPIQRILNLWTNRQIKIPKSVLTLLLGSIPLSSPSYGELLQRFHNPENQAPNHRVIRSRRNPFVRLSTGFMQGILHYTSSLVHLCFLYSSRLLTMSSLSLKHPNNRFTMTQVCSSDDSASIISCFTPENCTTIDRKGLIPFEDTEIHLEVLNHLCSFFCMRNSEKSATSLLDYVEFNSEFMFRNTLSMPIIKFTAASLGITESESFIHRFHTMYNCLSDLFASGFPSFNTTWVQISQAVLHYKTMGSSSNPLFSEYTDMILQIPSPPHGFFLLDCELCPGVLGYQYQSWMAYSNDPMLRASSLIIKKEALEVNPSGGLTESFSIKMGDLDRWQKLLGRVLEGPLWRDKAIFLDPEGKKELDDELRQKVKGKIKEIVSRNYQILFQHPNTIEELHSKLLIKASMPGVGKSLYKGNPFFQALSMSLYCLNTHCFSRTSLSKIITEGVSKRSLIRGKTSLLKDLRERVTESRIKLMEIECNCEGPCDHQRVEREIDDTLKLFHPMWARFNEVNELCDRFRDCSLREHFRMKNRKVVVMVQPHFRPIPLTLQQIVTKLWFDMNIRASNSVYKRCMNHYRVQFPWIEDTFEGTLKLSPFNTEIELYNFITSNPEKNRQFVRNGPSVYSSNFRDQMFQMMKKSYMQGHILVKPDNTRFFPDKKNTEASFGLALSIPNREARERIVLKMLEEESSEGDISTIKTMPKRCAILKFIALFHGNGVTTDEITDMQRALGMGTIWTYTKPQEKRVESDGSVTWHGKGEVLVICEEVNLRITMDDKSITKITTNTWKKLRSNPGMIRSIIASLGLSPSMTRRHQDKNVVARYGLSGFMHSTTTGVPIVEDLDMRIPVFDTNEVTFEQFRGKMGLYVVFDNKRLPIVEFSTMPRDVTTGFNTEPEDNPWSAWTNQQPITADKGVNMLSVIAEFSPFEPSGRATSEWARTTLDGRLRYRGIGRSGMAYTESLLTDSVIGHEEIDEMDDLEDDENDDFFNDLLGEMESDLQNSPIGKIFTDHHLRIASEVAAISNTGEVMEEIESAFISALEMDCESSPFRIILHNLFEDESMGSRTVTDTVNTSYTYLHPFWDDTVNKLENSSPRFFEMIYAGILPTINEEIAKSIMKLLHIDIRKRQSEMAQLFVTENTKERMANLLRGFEN